MGRYTNAQAQMKTVNNTIFQLDGLVNLLEKQDLADLDRAGIDAVAYLRKVETRVRLVRQRLEALRANNTRTCVCGEPIVGRSDAQYCSTTCRVAAHRARASTPA